MISIFLLMEMALKRRLQMIPRSISSMSLWEIGTKDHVQWLTPLSPLGAAKHSAANQSMVFHQVMNHRYTFNSLSVPQMAPGLSSTLILSTLLWVAGTRTYMSSSSTIKIKILTLAAPLPNLIFIHGSIPGREILD